MIGCLLFGGGNKLTVYSWSAWSTWDIVLLQGSDGHLCTSLCSNQVEAEVIVHSELSDPGRDREEEGSEREGDSNTTRGPSQPSLPGEEEPREKLSLAQRPSSFPSIKLVGNHNGELEGTGDQPSVNVQPQQHTGLTNGFHPPEDCEACAEVRAFGERRLQTPPSCTGEGHLCRAVPFPLCQLRPRTLLLSSTHLPVPVALASGASAPPQTQRHQTDCLSKVQMYPARLLKDSFYAPHYWISFSSLQSFYKYVESIVSYVCIQYTYTVYFCGRVDERGYSHCVTHGSVPLRNEKRSGTFPERASTWTGCNRGW